MLSPPPGRGKCSSLGDEETSAISTWYNMSYNSDEPDLVFAFVYRSAAMLRALGKIPRPESGKPRLTIDLTGEDDRPSSL